MSEPIGRRLISRKEVLKRIPISETTWYRGIREGRFAKPVRLGVRLRGWHEEEIEALIEKGVL
jgi:prophage regulatory protein